ncbi:MAG: HEAT repeat domain-containing protein [Gemmatimonadota bacterium]|nr:HEAT repeat domain-containing protein [Gemmatimonadota bacterium]
MFAIELLIKGTALIVVVFVAATALWRASAATRHLVWSCGLLGMLVLPLLIAIPWRAPVIPAWTEAPVVEPATSPVPGSESPTWETTAEPVAGGDPVAIGGSSEIAKSASAVPPSSTASSVTAEGWLDRLGLGSPLRLIVAAWALGAFVVAGRYVAGLWAVHRIVSKARRVEDSGWNDALAWASDRLLLDSPVQLFASDEVPMPLTAGILRPVVVLPTSALDWSIDRRRAVLVHELAHVRRKDALAHALTWVATAVWWFHPLVRVTARRLRAESERACDDLVLRAGTRASSYADHLLEIVCASDSRAPAAAMPLAQRSEFEGRMIRILEPDARRHGLSALRAVALAVAVFVIAVPLAVAGIAEPRPEQPAATRSAEAVATPEDGRETWDEVERTADRDREIERDDARDHDAGVDEDTETLEVTESESAGGEGAEDLSLLGAIDAKTTRDWVRAGARAAGTMLQSIPASVAQDGKVDEDELRETVLPAMVAALADQSPEVRETVARALGAVDDPRAVEALLRALRDDPDADVRRVAAWALGEIESGRAVSGLVRAVREDAHWEVRKMAAWALGEIESPEGVVGLRAAIADDHAEVRETAVWALGEIEDPAAVPALIDALRGGEPEIRRKAAWALGEIESPSAVDALVAALGDGDTEVRRQAAWALGEIEDPRAVAGLTGALDDSDRKTRLMAVWALGEMDLQSAPRALIEAAGDGDAEVREKVAWALGEIEDPAAVPALRRLLDDSNAKVRKYAIWALTEIEAPASYEALVELLRDEDPEVRKAAARALGEADVDWDVDTDRDRDTDR